MFLNPLFLIGMFAAGVPLAIHLMHRRHSRVVRWPSLRFLAAANRRTARRRQVQELLLLLMRMAILALLAVALSRPVVRAAGAAGAGARTAAVLVLDNSMSMSIRTGDTTAFARAKLAAEEVLRLTQKGRLALRFADGTEPPTAHAISPNREAVVTALKAASAGEARGDLGARVLEAIRDARESGVPAPEVHVLTDLQAAAFAGVTRAGGERGGPVSVIFVDCGVRDARNVAITSAAVRARRFVSGAPFGVDVRLRGFIAGVGGGAGPEGDAAAAPGGPESRLKIVLEFDGAARAERLVKLAPGGTVGFAFQAVFDRAGEVTGRIHLSPADSLPPDDVRHFRVHLADRVPVLVIDHGRSSIESARGAFYVEKALDPVGRADFGELSRAGAGAAEGEKPTGAKPAGSPLVPKVMKPAELEGRTARELLRISQVAVLTDLGPLEETEAALWVEFVRGGGSIIVFPSGTAGPQGTGGLNEAARAFERAAGAPFLPVEVGAASGDAEERNLLRRIDVDRVDFRHEAALAPFRELEETLRAVSVWRAYGLKPKHSAGGRELLPLDKGGAFLVARRFGEAGGEVHVFAVPATPEWSDFPARSLFLPLVHQLVYQATAPREEERSFLVGSRPRVSLPADLAGRRVRFVEPGGRSTAVLVGGGAGEEEEGEGAPGEGSAMLELPRLARTGVYRIQGDELPGGEITLVANTDPEESDTARLGEARLRELYGDLAGRDPAVIRGSEGLAKVIARVRKGLELWDLFFATVLSVALFESFFSNRLAAGASNRLAAGAKRASGGVEGAQT